MEPSLLERKVNGSRDYNMTLPIPSHSDLLLLDIIHGLNVYAIPVIILVGLVGNTVSFLVYACTPHMRRMTSSIYLGYLAAVDSCFLLCLFAVWFGWVGVHAVARTGWCHMIIFTTYVCGFLAAWTVVSFTFERWVVVFMPLKRHYICTRKRAMMTMVVLTLFALTFYSFSIWTTGMRDQGEVSVCAPSRKFYDVLKVMTSIDTIISVVIPCLAIVVMNVGIGMKLCRYTSRPDSSTAIPTPLESMGDTFSNFSSSFKRMSLPIGRGEAWGAGRNSVVKSLLQQTQQQQQQQQQPQQQEHVQEQDQKHQQPTGHRPWRILTRRRHTQWRITRALLIVSSVFLILNAPSYAFRVRALVMSLQSESLNISIKAYFWLELLQFLYYLNFAGNFFLYSACSRNFRHAVRRLLRRSHTKMKRWWKCEASNKSYPDHPLY